MLIDRRRCTGCGDCICYCPVGAIVLLGHGDEELHASIRWGECVECSVCLRSAGCKESAFVEEELRWPRVLRRAFSDPLFVHEGTDVPGRGTEEMKTNEVTGRYQPGWVGVGLEFGRPGVGARFRDIDKATRLLVGMGIALEPRNPLTALIDDPASGALRAEILDERVLSAIVECIVPTARLEELLAAVLSLAEEIETVFSLGMSGRVATLRSRQVTTALEHAGLSGASNGKVNVGLGRPRFEARAADRQGSRA